MSTNVRPPRQLAGGQQAVAGVGGTPAREADAVGVWLDGLVRVMRLPAREAGEIREELDAHVRERVRDLMLAGQSEASAIHHAIGELGDAALLAQRFHAVSSTTKRRSIMTFAALGIAVGALALSTLTLTGSRVPTIVPHAAPPTAPATIPTSDAQRDLSAVLSARIETSGDTTYREFFDMIRDAAGGSLVDGSVFDDIGIDIDDSIMVSSNGMPIGTALEMLNRRIHPEAIVLLAHEGGVEITTQREADRRNMTLVAYTIAEPLGRGVEADEIAGLLTSFVEPPHWVDNGGDLASYQIVGDRLFVECPTRFLGRIEWILDQLDAGASAQVEARREQADASTQMGVALAGQMRQIALLMITHASETGEMPTMPSQVRQFAEESGVSPETFLSPADRMRLDPPWGGGDAAVWAWLDENGSFQMLPGELYDGTSRILVEKVPAIDGKRVIAFGDSHVEVVSAVAAR